MIGLLLLSAALATAQFAKAEAKNSPASWVLPSDLPPIEGESAVTTFDLTIDDTGHPIRCDIVIRSEVAKLDSSVCAAVMQRARFKPARDEKGAPVMSVRRDRVIWLPKAYGQNNWYNKPDIVIKTPKITKEYKYTTEVILAMNDAGSVENCFVSQTSKNQILDDLACNVSREKTFALPINNVGGASKAGLRSFYVAFQPGPILAAQIR